MDKEKILFIPGWMDKGGFHGFTNSLNIWTEKTKLDYKFDADFVIGYSAGANVAILNWDKKDTYNLILINPMVPKRNFVVWTYKWIKYILNEGTQMTSERLKILRHFVLGFRVLIKMLKVDPLEIINKIPKDKLTIMRGSEDIHFCDKETIEKLKKEGVKVIEIEGMGHNWNKEIENFLNNYKYE